LRPAAREETSIEPLAVALVLCSAVVHAGWNRLLHGEDDRVAALTVAGLVAGVALLPAIVAWPPWNVLPLVLVSAATEVAYALGLSAAYQRGALSVAYPLARGMAPLLVTLGGWLLLAQRPDPLAAVGAAALAAGLAAIAVAGGRRGQRGAVAFALLTGVTIATYSVVDAAAVRQVSPVGYLGAVMGLQGLLLVALVPGNRARVRRNVRPGVLIALGLVSGYLLVLFAFQRAPAGRVATLREASVLIGVILSGERPPPIVWGGAALVVIGALLAAS
jgi:drug/metabolite transporter (DMT)-like permease